MATTSVAIGGASQAAAVSDTGPAQSRDSALIDIYNTITDEAGRYSDQDKLGAYRRWQELSQATDVQRPYGFAGYSTKDIQLFSSADFRNSSFMRAHEAFNQKFAHHANSTVQSGQRDSVRLQGWVDFYDALSPLEKGFLDSRQSDFRETHVALKKTFLKLERDVDAGRFKWGTPIEQVKDAGIRAALLLIDRIQASDMANRRAAHFEADTLDGGYGSAIQDSVSLSQAAQDYLSGR